MERKRHYLIPQEIVALLPDTAQEDLEIISSDDRLFLAMLDRGQVSTLAERIHASTALCGGFVDVEEEWLANRIKRGEPSVWWEKINSGFSDLRDVAAKVDFDANREAAQQVLGRLDIGITFDYIKRLTSFDGRFWDLPGGRKSAEWVAGELENIAGNAGLNITITRIPLKGYEEHQFSVLAKIAGEREDLPGVLLGAHLDSIRTKYGADDDASGTAAVMSVFRAFAESGATLKRDAFFALYAAEEVGLRGSSRVARKFVKDGIQLGGVMQLDMIGFDTRKNEESIFFVTTDTTPSLVAFTKDVAKKYLGEGLVIRDTTLPAQFNSDHYSWFVRGYRTVFPFESDASEIDNNRIHSNADTVDSLSPAHAEKFLRLAAGFVLEMAIV